MADERIRIEVAFDGGQIMSALISVDGADALERALADGRDDALSLEAEDGRYIVPLRRVVYVKRFTRESRVGFASA